MSCIICLKTVRKKQLICGHGHDYHSTCFKKFNRKTCLICDQYITYVYENVLNESACKKIINKGNEIGFTDVQTNKYNDTYINKKIRNNKACVLKDEYIFKLLKYKIGDLVDKNLELYDNLRFTKYEKGNFMVKHLDNKFKSFKINNKYYSNDYSVIIFLNTTRGGDLRMYNDSTYYDIQPKMGSVVIFHQDLNHEALPVKNGVKYNIRTDLVEEIKTGLNLNGSLVKLPVDKVLKLESSIKAMVYDCNKSLSSINELTALTLHN